MNTSVLPKVELPKPDFACQGQGAPSADAQGSPFQLLVSQLSAALPTVASIVNEVTQPSEGEGAQLGPPPEDTPPNEAASDEATPEETALDSLAALLSFLPVSPAPLSNPPALSAPLTVAPKKGDGEGALEPALKPMVAEEPLVNPAGVLLTPARHRELNSLKINTLKRSDEKIAQPDQAQDPALKRLFFRAAGEPPPQPAEQVTLKAAHAEPTALQGQPAAQPARPAVAASEAGVVTGVTPALKVEAPASPPKGPAEPLSPTVKSLTRPEELLTLHRVERGPETARRGVERAVVPASPEPIDEPAVMRRVLDGVRLASDGRQRVDVELSPAELGRVRVRVELERGAARIVLTADQAKAAEILSAHIDQLRGDLLAQGVQVLHCEVRQEPAQGREDPAKRRRPERQEDEDSEEAETPLAELPRLDLRV